MTSNYYLIMPKQIVRQTALIILQMDDKITILFFCLICFYKSCEEQNNFNKMQRTSDSVSNDWLNWLFNVDVSETDIHQKSLFDF